MLRVEDDGPVLRLKLDRPEVRNAFNEDLIARLHEAFRTLPGRTRVVVLEGLGKAFCAGGDLDWMRRAANYSEEENARDALGLAHLYQAVAECPAAVIARVHGAAFGGGLGLVAAADIAIAAEDAKFAFSEVRLGLIPATISPFVIRKIGPGHARALFVTGEPFGAEKALKVGLVHEVEMEEELDAAVEGKIAHLLRSGPQAVAGAKKLVLDGPLSLEEAATRLARARASEEAREGIAAFLEKRAPSFAEGA